MSHVTQLETDLRQKQDAFRALYGKYSALAEQENRESSDTERAELQTLLDDAKKIKARLDRSKGDRAISEEMEALYGRTTAAIPSQQRVQPATLAQMKTAGQLWAESDGYKFFKDGLHH